MTIFDGITHAAEIEARLTEQAAQLAQRGVRAKIAAILYDEDQGSVLYTRLKSEAAQRVGIDYQVDTFSLNDSVDRVLEHLKALNQDPSITGIIIQKPWRKLWQEAKRVEGDAVAVRQAFNAWWQLQTSQINLKKDVDGLNPETLAAIEAGDWLEKGLVLPATARAVETILKQAGEELGWVEGLPPEPKVVILGKSDILGKPLTAMMRHRGWEVSNFGTAELADRQNSGKSLHGFTVVVSATGQKHLVTGEMIDEGAVVIDVGEPRPDVERESVAQKAAFLTPVPGGVGPMTVVSLLENGLELVG